MFLSDLWYTGLIENRNENARIMQNAVKKAETSLNKLISSLNEEQRALLEEILHRCAVQHKNLNDMQIVQIFSSPRSFQYSAMALAAFFLSVSVIAFPPIKSVCILLYSFCRIIAMTFYKFLAKST